MWLLLFRVLATNHFVSTGIPFSSKSNPWVTNYLHKSHFLPHKKIAICMKLNISGSWHRKCCAEFILQIFFLHFVSNIHSLMQDISNSSVSAMQILQSCTWPLICEQWDDIGSWNSSPWKTRTYLSYTANIMTADALVMQGSRASAAMVLV